MCLFEEKKRGGGVFSAAAQNPALLLVCGFVWTE